MKLHSADRVAAFTKAGLWGAELWPDLLARHTKAMPDRLAVADPPNLAVITDSAPQRLTWSELSHRVDDVAAVLRANGIGEDDVVGLQLPNSVDLAVSYLALTSIGAIITPFPVQYREFELSQMGALAHMTAFISAGAILGRPLEPVAAALQSVPEIGAILCFGSTVPDGVVGIDILLDGQETPTSTAELDNYRRGLDRDPNNAVTICWTSGTESTPKGVPRCPNDWYPMAISSVDAMEFTVDDVLLNPFPMVNMAGIGGILVPWLLTGATLIQHHPFDGPAFFGQIAQERVTYTVAAPALLIRALELPTLTPELLASVRVIGSGSAPLPPSMIMAWRERFGIDIANCFGSNEGISLVSDARTVPEPTERSVLFPRFGSPDHVWQSRAARGVRSRLVDPVTGQLVTEPLVAGELRLIGPGIFSGYLAGTASSTPFDDEGYFCTGDLFQYVTDAAGDMRFLQYVDRAKDLIVRGGMNISPAEIESLVIEHPKVAEVAVIGTPDPALGERTRAGAAAVVLAGRDYAAAWAAANGLHLQDLAVISGFGHRTDTLLLADKFAISAGGEHLLPQLQQTIQDAYARAGIAGIADIDVVEMHDCFSITGLVTLEHLGLVAGGKGAEVVLDGTLERDGTLPVNPGGGLLSGGHPVGATGVRMVLDAHKQVTGRAGVLQVEGAKRVLTVNVGGSFTTTVSFVVESGRA